MRCAAVWAAAEDASRARNADSHARNLQRPSATSAFRLKGAWPEANCARTSCYSHNLTAKLTMTGSVPSTARAPHMPRALTMRHSRLRTLRAHFPGDASTRDIRIHSARAAPIQSPWPGPGACWGMNAVRKPRLAAVVPPPTVSDGSRRRQEATSGRPTAGEVVPSPGAGSRPRVTAAPFPRAIRLAPLAPRASRAPNPLKRPVRGAWEHGAKGASDVRPQLLVRRGLGSRTG